jgi:nicotinamidase/pyrazinamidase
VPNANEIVPLINKLRNNSTFDYVFLSRDWHPANHCSFSVNNPGSKLFESIVLPDTGAEQMMWPVHCVQESDGAKF